MLARHEMRKNRLEHICSMRFVHEMELQWTGWVPRGYWRVAEKHLRAGEQVPRAPHKGVERVPRDRKDRPADDRGNVLLRTNPLPWRIGGRLAAWRRCLSGTLCRGGGSPASGGIGIVGGEAPKIPFSYDFPQPAVAAEPVASTGPIRSSSNRLRKNTCMRGNKSPRAPHVGS